MSTVGAHPSRLDLVVHDGFPVDVVVPVLDALGVLVPVTGWAVSVRAFDLDRGPLHTFTTAVLGSTIRVTATPTQTAAWASSWASRVTPWSVVATDLGGVPHLISAGWIRLYP